MQHLSPALAPPPADRARAIDPGALGAIDAPQESLSAFDLRAIWSTIYRHRFPMAAIVAGAVLLGVITILVLPRVYQARASVEIDQQVAKVLGTEDTSLLSAGSDADRFLQTQMDVLTSRAMANRVADSLGLAANDDFLRRMSGAGDVRATAGGGTRIERVMDVLERNLKIDVRRNSGVVAVLFTSRDPALAAQVANSYVNNYIQGNIQRKFSATAYSRKFLMEQLGLAKGRLENSERALIAYARGARLIDASAGATRQSGAEGPRSLVTANLVDLNSAYADADTNLLRARQRWEQARATPLMSLPDVLQNQTIQQLTQKRTEAAAALNQLSIRLKPDHPTMVQADAELSSLDHEIQKLAQSIRASIESQFLTAQRQQRAIQSQVSALKNATLAEQDRTVQYNILQREVDTNRQLYESLLQRYKQVSAEAGVATNNATLVDSAEAPRKPISPRPTLDLALALIGGMALALLYAFGRDYLDDTIRDPQDVELKLGVPLLGVVPEVTRGDPHELLLDNKSDIAEAYHSVRTAIDLSSNQGTPHSILVTGGGPAEGKSTTSFALAQDFARVGRSVLLIDADLRRPSLHHRFGVKPAGPGLSTVLARHDQVENAIVATDTPHLSLLPSGPIPPDPATLLAGTAMADLLDRLREQFEVIVIDGPPVLALADATQLGAAAAATVFVAEAGGAHFGRTRNAVQRLTRLGANLVGCVVTKYNARKLGYGESRDYYRYGYASVAAR